MEKRSTRKFTILLGILVATVPGWTTVAQAQVNDPLTIQEALYPGAPTSGIARTQDPVTVGLPIPDSAGITNENQLGLSGASAGQFRILGRWPSGHAKWVLVDTFADLGAGGQNNSIALTAGAGNFGGSNMATDNGATITVNTGTAQFTIKKANFDLFDSVIVGGATVVSAGSSQGLVLTGPDSYGNTVCDATHPCTTSYASANDPNSSAVIEENGPVKAVIKATGAHLNSVGQIYMRFTVRMTFYAGKTQVKVSSILQNADYGTSNTFQSASKGFTGYNANVGLNLGSGRGYTFAGNAGNVLGNFSGTENAYLYQAYSNNMEDCGFIGPSLANDPRSPIQRTPVTSAGCLSTWNYAQSGYQVIDGSTLLGSGSSTQYPQGWADIKDSAGKGVEIGVYEMSAYWPKSLQFMNGGGSASIGIFPDQSLYQGGGTRQQYLLDWPQYAEHILFFNFHNTALADAPGDFLRFQYKLIARTSVTAYNTSGVFPYKILDPTVADNFYASLGAATVKDLAPNTYRGYPWGMPGGGNQTDWRWSNLILWLQKGFTGRFLSTEQFNQFVREQAFARSDYNGSTPFHWRDGFVPAASLDNNDKPANVTTQNINLLCDPGAAICGRTWIDDEHAHWYGLMDYYFLTGDEATKDAIESGATDSYGNPNTVAARNGQYTAPRSVGEALMAGARLYTFYNAIGDAPDAANALTAADQVVQNQVMPELQVSGYGSAYQNAVSRTRGAYVTHSYGPQRFDKPFQTGIVGEGLWEYMQAHGPSWPGYWKTFDLAHGLTHWALTEGWVAGTGTSGCTASGFTYQVYIDQTNALPTSCDWTVWFNFFIEAKYGGLGFPWQAMFKTYMKTRGPTGGFGASGIDGEEQSIYQEAVAGEILNPEPLSLVSVPINATNNGGGSYTLSWTVPNGAQIFRIKYSAKSIVDWIGFDPVNNAFIGDPATTWNWWASTDVASVPLPAAPGTVQTMTVTGLDPTQPLKFAMKAYTTIPPSDTAPPTMAITFPSNGATVSNIVTVAGSAQDDVAVSSVAVSIDGAPFVPAEFGSTVWNYRLNTIPLMNGSHTIAVKAIDIAGLSVTASITINISNVLGNVPLSAFWKYDEGAGSTANDSSGNRDTGSLNGGFSWTSGRIGGAVNFDGSTGFMSTVSSFTVYPNNFSVSAWFKTTATTGGAVMAIGGNQTSTTSGSFDRVMYLNNSGQVGFMVGITTLKSISSTASFNNGGWHQAVATIGSDGMKLYVDGTQVASDASTTVGGDFGEGIPVWWRVGDDPALAGKLGASNSFFNGTLDNVRVITQELSPFEVGQLYNLDTGTLTTTVPPARPQGLSLE